MKVFKVIAKRGVTAPLFLFDVRVALAAVGVLLAVVVHEAFHALVHWGEISSYAFFATPYVLFQMHVGPTDLAKVEGEEAIAYALTFLTLIMTALVIAKVHDTKDSRSFSDIMHKRNKKYHLSSSEMMTIINKW